MIDSSGNLWGIDLGGTKIEGIVLKSVSDPKVLYRDRVPTENSRGYTHVKAQLAKLVAHMEGHMGYRPLRVGMGTPGILDARTQLIKNSNSTCLNGMPLKQDLEAELQVKLSFANDANCFALAETHVGIVKEKFPNAEVVFGVILGTGVGGGLVVNNKIISGLHGIVGEWGHNVLDESGTRCYCGKRGCVEAFLSGPALEGYYFSISGNRKLLPEIYEDSIKGEACATQTIDRLCYYFGKAISVVVNIVDPDVIVIGGGVGNIDLLYERGYVSLREHIFNDYVATPIVKPKLGDSAGVFGAAFLTA